MKTRLILVALDGKEKEIYLKMLEVLEVDVVTVSTFKELETCLIKTPYQGVLVDLKTKIKSLKKEKELAYQILEQFPVVQLNVEDRSGTIKSLYYGKSKGEGTLKDFILNECLLFKARKLRASQRTKIHFNALLSPTDQFTNETSERTITIDVSSGGCFVFSVNIWEPKNSVWMVFLDLEDLTPIRAEIRWTKPWGKSMQLPGIGLRFKEIAENQLKEIRKFCEAPSLPSSSI